MTMTFSLHENVNFTGNETRAESFSRPRVELADVHICASKLKIPETDDFIERPRLIKLLEKNSEQFGATLVTGRAGTGKTALAAGFAKSYEQIAWYSVGAADCEWKIFSSYLCASFKESRLNLKCSEDISFSDSELAVFIEKLFSRLNVIGRKKPLLIVLDDIHHVFDCSWFDFFFNSFLHSLTPQTHLLLLARSQPPLPLWRLRSKQLLGVIDEKLLALTVEEKIDLYSKRGLSEKTAERFYKEPAGRISKIKLFE